jgi:hypothetical protein
MIVGALLIGSRFYSRTRLPSYTAALELVVPKSKPTRMGSLLTELQIAGFRPQASGFMLQLATCSL